MAKKNELHKSALSKTVKKTDTWLLLKGFVHHHKALTLVMPILLLAVTGLGIYTLNREDLGEQLPPPAADAVYRQSSQPIDARVKDLLSRMTLEEKIGQMSLVDKNSLQKHEDISRYYLGGVLSGAGAKPNDNTPQGWSDMVNGIKREASKSRLGIPILFGVDANHGHANVPGATVFPHAIGLGASNDVNLVQSVAEATSAELAATGINWSYSPSLDAPKDIRWGRVYEAFSDSPELNGRLGSAYVEGIQKSENGTYVLGTAKHFLATGAMQWGASNHKTFKIDQGKTRVDEIALANEYLPPYKAVVTAGVSSVMIGLNQWGDQRIIDSKYLVTDKLKNELGFTGIVVSDWYGVYEYAKTGRYEANIKTINAGLDMAMLPYEYKDFLKDVRRAVRDGRISEARIDDAVSRILYQKFKAGLFDVSLEATSLATIGSEEHRTLARKAVASSAVLLKNNNSVLPLSKNTKRILVAGSGADNIGRQSGAWTIEWQGVDGNWMPGGNSILQGIRELAGSDTSVEYALNGSFSNIAEKADVGIAVISEKPYAEGHGDNPNPTIEKADLEAIDRLKMSAKKVVIVIVSGRPLLIDDQLPSWDAAVAAWLPGSEGSGVADVLFGKTPFTAKLPMTWPANISQIPINADGTTQNNTRVQFKRGWGL